MASSNMILDFYIITSVTTSSPSSNSEILSSEKYPRLLFKPVDWFNDGEAYFQLNFPSLHSVEGSVEDHLDSLLVISTHDIRSDISDNSDFSSMFLLYSENNSTSGLMFPIASYYGEQEQNTLEVINYSKEIEGDFSLYEVELQFSCNLYHDPIYSFSPNLWKSIEKGTLKFSFSILRDS